MNHPIKISKNLSSKVLTIVPDHHNHRGSGGAVMHVFSKYFEVFNFIASYRVGSSFYISYVYFLENPELIKEYGAV